MYEAVKEAFLKVKSFYNKFNSSFLVIFTFKSVKKGHPSFICTLEIVVSFNLITFKFRS